MTDEQSQRAPYPGLRAFRREETDLFFGREDCINAMVDRLAATRFLSVLGSSGTGKSSLVRTGLLDALELGLMAKAGSRWTIVDFKPGGSPLKNLARRLLEAQNPDTEVAQQDVDLLRAYLSRGPRAIIEWCRAGHLPAGSNLLLLVDQFEELFRYQDYAGREEAEAFVALLIESAHQADVPIYITITMRSEYLGACALIEGLSDAINAGMFLTPRMTREHCREAIVGPAAVCNIDIEPALVNRLLNDLTEFAPFTAGEEQGATDQLNRLMRRADQLPLLQYTLNRMWQRARERSSDQRVNLTLQDYEAIEGLRGALNAHANQIFLALGKDAHVAEWVFRSLTAGSTIADAVRRPTRLDDLIAACGGDEKGVRAVVDAFRAPDVNFLTPEYDPDHPRIAPDTYIDISHESLIRQWKKLSEWLEAEARASQQWRRLVDRQSVGEPLRGRELANFAAWRKETKPNECWAKRYGGDYPAVISYLDKSQHAQNTKRTAMIGSVVGAFVLITVIAIYAILQRNEAVLQRNMVEQQSAQLEERLKETQDLRGQLQGNQVFFTDAFTRMFFSLQAPLSSERSTSQAAPPPRREAPTRSERDGEQTSDQTQTTQDANPQDSADRATSQTEPQNLALTAVTILEGTARALHLRNPDNVALQRLFVLGLIQLGETKLQQTNVDVNSAERDLNEGLATVRAMLKVNPNESLWKDDLALALAGVGRVKVRRDQHADARQYFQEAIGIERELIAAHPDDRLLRNLQVHLGELGDIHIKLNERQEARDAFEERLKIREARLKDYGERLARAPGNRQLRAEVNQLKSEVSVALDRVGQLVRDSGDPSGSRIFFERALKIDRELFAVDPTKRAWQENLVTSLSRIGDLERQLGRQREALNPFEEAVSLQRSIINANAPAPLQQLASYLQRVGDINRRLKQFPAAISAHSEELELRRRLLSNQKTNLVARRNVSAALDYLGNTYRESGDLPKARTSFTEQLEIDRGILKEYPNEDRSQEDAVWSLNRIGDLERQLDRFKEAANYYEESLGIQRRLNAREVDDPRRMRALALLVSKLGQVRSRLTQHSVALTLHREELDLRQRLYERAPQDNDALRDLSLANDRVGNALRDLSDALGALKFFEAELALDRSFVARAPINLTALGDVQWTLNKISDFVWKRLNDRPTARRYMEEMIGIDRRLIERQPASRDRFRRLRDDLAKFADLLIEMNDPAAARDAYGDAFASEQRWLGIARDNYMRSSTEPNRNDLAQAYSDAGWHALLAGRVKEALPLIEGALSINPDTPWNTVNLGHARLFLGQYDEALAQYRSVKDRSRTQDGKRRYSDEIRDDFALFRRLGLMLPDMARIARALSL